MGDGDPVESGAIADGGLREHRPHARWSGARPCSAVRDAGAAWAASRTAVVIDLPLRTIRSRGQGSGGVPRRLRPKSSSGAASSPFPHLVMLPRCVPNQGQGDQGRGLVWFGFLEEGVWGSFVF